MMSTLQEIQSKLNITSKSLKRDVFIEEINVNYFANYGKMFTDIASDLDEYLEESKKGK